MVAQRVDKTAGEHRVAVTITVGYWLHTTRRDDDARLNEAKKCDHAECDQHAREREQDCR